MKIEVIRGCFEKTHDMPDNGTVLTDFDLIDMDEGRWYPYMWWDAWK